MKTSFITLIALLSLVQQTQAANYQIVLGVNLDPSEKQFYFPCVEVMATAVFCDDTVKIEDSECAKTLSYKSNAAKTVDISCHVKDGRYVVIARAQGELTLDSTQDGFGSVSLKLTPAVYLQPVPGNRNKQLLIIK